MISESGLLPAEINMTRHEKESSLRSCIDNKAVFFVMKRFADLVFSILFIIIILSWLFPIVALLIWIDSGGRVLFIQERVGRGGKTFLCLKFRTMLHLPGELPRITALGNFLRKSNIDEFPQFVNVLMGNMSIVGPRPHTHSDCRRFSSLIPRYKLRNFVKPGITGLAQIKGFHGPAILEESIISRYEWDIYYVQNASFWLDIRVIRQTAIQSFANLLRLSRLQAPVPSPSSS